MNTKNKLKIFSLGGRGEVGNNMIVMEYKDNILILDAGVLFPDPYKYGIDLIIPDISYLIDNKEKIKGIVFSHGHEDHIGAVPYIYHLLDVPLYGTDLTIGLIKNKLESAGLLDKARTQVISEDKTLKLEPFEINFCHVNHSIPGCVAMAISTPVGLIIYTGDYKFDQTPINNPQTDYQRLSQWGNQGVLALLGDSTNSEREGHTLSEKVVAQNIEDSFKLVKQRIIIATFSSNIDRIQHIITAGHNTGRKVAISGWSMQKTVEVASELGYLKIPEQTLITIDQANKLEPGKVILLMTGSQGEYRASLTKIARGEHRDITTLPGDTVFLSSSPIPGNEKAIGDTINMLYENGAEVLYDGMLDLHASGHACQEEIKMMINLIRPKYLIPVHGEFRHLYHHAQLGRHMGLPVENILIGQNGDIIEITPDSARLTDTLEIGQLYIESNKLSDTGDIVLKDRKRLAENGFIIIILPATVNNNILPKPKLISRGFVFNKDSEKLLNGAKQRVIEYLDNKKEKTRDFSLIKKDIYHDLKKYFYEMTNRSPLILTEFVKVKGE
ncbi:MAG: ribonuclease J [Halothermotrichaceae bacterium]